jgi:proteasome lid subunit RPN8/RPN11
MHRNPPFLSLDTPVVWMRRHVRCQIMCSIGGRRPESGGILLGPVGGNDITAFYFDGTARRSGGAYSPDHLTLRQKMRDEWLPAGLDMKGFVHSHPRGYTRLSDGDMQYIGRLLAVNPDMTLFAAPIVFPDEFLLRPFVVLAEQPSIQRSTCLRLF